jgi:hypothetical protein
VIHVIATFADHPTGVTLPRNWFKQVVMSAKSLTLATAVTAALGATVSPPTVAGAAPPGFPDANTFTAVNPQGYLLSTTPVNRAAGAIR